MITAITKSDSLYGSGISTADFMNKVKSGLDILYAVAEVLSLLIQNSFAALFGVCECGWDEEVCEPWSNFFV